MSPLNNTQMNTLRQFIQDKQLKNRIISYFFEDDLYKNTRSRQSQKK